MRKIKNLLILAGGDSTRFWPLSEKGMFCFQGKPLILHLIDQVKQYADTVSVVTSKKNNQEIQNCVGNSIKTIPQEGLVEGMAGAILSASKVLTGEVLILNANDLLDFSIIPRLVEKAEKEKYRCVFTAKRIQEYFPGGYLELKDNKVIGIVEKPDPAMIPSPFITLVVHYFADIQEFIQTLETIQTDKDDHYEKALSAYLQIKPAGYVEYDGEWTTIKYPWHILSTMKYLLPKKGQQGKGVIISKNAKLEGPVVLGNNVKIYDNVKIVGPCYIGDNCIIGDNSLIRESNIENNTVIGSFSEVARVYLASGVTLHRNYIGDSVLGKNVHIGAQAVTANYRFDGKVIYSHVHDKKIDTGRTKLGAIIGDNARVGCNSTTLPGIKIGQQTQVGPGSVVTADIPEKMFYFKNELKPNKDL